MGKRGMNKSMRSIKSFVAAAGILSVAVSGYSSTLSKPNDYQFARQYTNEMMVNSASKREEFVEKLLRAESKFLQPGIAYNPLSGLTYDGHPIDFDTGELRGFPKNWSAASKESLHIMVLSLAVSGNKGAKILISPDNVSEAQEVASKILERKITSYENFNKKYPGFGGYLPWFVVTDRGMEPTWDWEDRAPALDNGQLAWSLMMASHALRREGYTKLSSRFADYWEMMAKNCVPMFFDKGHNLIRGVAKIKNVKGSVKSENYESEEVVYHVTDPYEGELMALFMTLYGKWDKPEDIVSIWHSKNLAKAVYETQDGHKITVRKGFWYSVHEMWNFLVLPYMDDPLIKQVFMNGEKARSWYSAENNIPGLMASVNEPVSGNVSGKYLSDVGIPQLATVAVTRQDVVSPYGAFPMIMADRGIGAAWLRTMLDGPSMVGPYGTTEAASTDGRRIAPLLTWDGKVTTVLALLGESTDMMREVLKESEKYDQFLSLVSGEYAKVFGRNSLEGTNLAFRTPTAVIPKNLPDFSVSRKVTDVLRSGKFIANGELQNEFALEDNTLKVRSAKGYLWTQIQPTDMRNFKYINLDVRQTEGHEKTIFVELKNDKDQLITDRKICLKIPYTGEQFTSYTIDVGSLVTNPSANATVFVFSDPDGEMEFKRATITSAQEPNAKMLAFNSRSFTAPVTLEARSRNLDYANFK